MKTESTNTRPRLLRLPEVMARLGLGKSKVHELIITGRLPSVKIDGARRVRDDVLETFINNLESGIQ